MTLLTTLLMTLVGLSLGLLGGGGSTLAVPVLVFVAGLSVRGAITVSLLVVALTSLVGAVLHHRRGRVDLRAAVRFMLAGGVGAVAGARLATRIPDEGLAAAFGLLMLITGVRMLRADPSSGARRSDRPGVSRMRMLGVGFVVGILTGFLGVGGGFLVVPALCLFGRLPIRDAIGTSLLVISVNAAMGFLAHLSGEQVLVWRQAGPWIVAAVAGAVVGERLAARLPASLLRRGFAALVVVVGLAMLGRAVIHLVG